MRTRLLLAATAASLAVVSPAAASEAPAETSIGYVEGTDEGLKILVNVPADATVDVDDVAVTVDGVDAAATAAPADSTTSVRRTAVLVMDTSNSMHGDRFAAAQAAAHTFLDTVPDDVYVGIISFDNDVTEEFAPSLDRDEASDVVDGLQLSEQTRLYDGVQAGLGMAGTDGQRQLLVLSDGADTGGDATLDDTTTAIEDSESLVNVVGLEQSGRAVDALQSLSDAGGGSLINADSKALEKAFTAQADVLARQVLVSATVPSDVTAAEGTVTVALGSDVGTLTADAFTPLGRRTPTGPEAPTVLPEGPALALSQTWLFGGLAALGVGLLTLLVAIGPRKQRPMKADEIALTYTQQITGGSHRADVNTAGQSGQVTETAEKVLKANKSLESRIAERLEGAGNPFQPAEWVVVHLTVFLTAGVLGLLLGGGSLILGLLFLALGAIGPWFFLGFKRKRRRKAFERLLPDTLQLMSGSLAAGLSLAQSIDTIVREGQEPVAGEFRRVLIETRLGISLDDALEGVSLRFDSKDFAWVVMAIRIQRQVGGNLAELLDTVAATMRDREYMRRQVAALAAEGKLSAWVLGCLPPGFLGYLMLAKRDYVMVMFTDPRGWLMLGGAGLFLSLGVFWMSRLVKVEV